MSLPRLKSEDSNVVYFLRIDIKVFPTDFVFSTVAFAKNIVAPRVNTVTAEVTAKSNNLFIFFLFVIVSDLLPSPGFSLLFSTHHLKYPIDDLYISLGLP